MRKSNGRKVVVFLLFLIWISFICYAVFFYKTGNVTYTPPIETFKETPPNSEIPPVGLQVVYTMTAQGSFSAENPITVSVKVINANVSNLLDYYVAIGFFDSVFATKNPSIHRDRR